MMKPIKEWKLSTKIIVSTFTIILFLLIGLSVFSYIEVRNAMDRTYEPVDRITSTVTLPEEDNDANYEEKPKTYLLLGIDQWPNSNDVGRTDVIMLATVNDSTKKITLTSIPRDTYVEIAGKGYKDKINHAYQHGLETTIATVENFTEVPIDNYVLFTFDSFVKSIDAIGGITVNVDKNIANYNFGSSVDFVEGEQHLNGKEALVFSRFRYDINGDYGRNNRQQQVVKAILDQSKSFATASKISELLDIAGDEIRTDITFKEMVDLSLQVKGYSSEDIVKITYDGHSERFGEQNLWYNIITEEERVRVSNLLKESLLDSNY